MKGEESAVVPDPRFVLDAASGLYYHARDACKESAQGFCICFLSLSLSLSNSSTLHDTEVKLFFVWIFLLFLFCLRKKKITACKKNTIVIIMLLLLKQSSQKNKKSRKELTGYLVSLFCQHQEENRESSNFMNIS